jgi:hypothetical protein
VAKGLIVTVSIGLLFLVLGIALGFYVSWSATVRVTTTDPDIQIFWDAACTNPVTSIEVGNVQRGATKTITLYVKNQGGGTLHVYWNSTLREQTNQISESWLHYYMSNYVDINGTTLGEGASMQTRYDITVGPDAPLQTYTWSLNIGG